MHVQNVRMDKPEHLQPSRPDQKVILIVDDEVMVRNIVRITLQDAGYFVLVAANGQEALSLSRKFPGTIDVVITDVLMPNLNGIELRDALQKERPGTPILFMTGHADA